VPSVAVVEPEAFPMGIAIISDAVRRRSPLEAGHRIS
jgi:hypothetical protein